MSTDNLFQNVVFLNPQSCGTYKKGGVKYKFDQATGLRTSEIDNEMLDHVNRYLAGEREGIPGFHERPLGTVIDEKTLVPRYYDQRHREPFSKLLGDLGVDSISLGELRNTGKIHVLGGHGSPSNDLRIGGSVPYIKVSDIRNLRVNVNPTNLVSHALAERIWKGPTSGIHAWDLISPNRASSNIGEFAVILPGEEQIVVTKEVFIFRSMDDEIYTPFYLLWALSLKAVRQEWQRVTLMQTNREDVGQRYNEILIPRPPTREWALRHSEPFRDYFEGIASARERFVASIQQSDMEFIASVRKVGAITLDADDSLRNNEFEQSIESSIDTSSTETS